MNTQDNPRIWYVYPYADGLFEIVGPPRENGADEFVLLADFEALKRDRDELQARLGGELKNTEHLESLANPEYGFPSEIRKLKADRDRLLEAHERIASDTSPPWDPTDLREISRKAIAARSPKESQTSESK